MLPRRGCDTLAVAAALPLEVCTALLQVVSGAPSQANTGSAICVAVQRPSVPATARQSLQRSKPQADCGTVCTRVQCHLGTFALFAEGSDLDRDCCISD